MRKLTFLLIALGLISLSCRRTPSGVLSKKEMSRLLADMHIAESVVDLNQNEYHSDSMKRVLKESVLRHHGVTQETFDTSLVWYGQHLDMYIKVYDDVIANLEKRNRELGTALVQSAITMAGDSVDVWSGLRYATLDNRAISRYLTFDIERDENWEKGDVYTWRLKLLDNENLSVQWSIVAEYEDNQIESLTATTGNSDWNEVIFAGDSTKIPTRIKGYVEVRPARAYSQADKERTGKLFSSGYTTNIDSLSLIRKRLNPDSYRYHTRVRTHTKL